MVPKSETLMEQATYTAEFWMKEAIKSIDDALGNGYAKKNPALIAGFMQAASNDQLAMYIRSLANMINNGDLIEGSGAIPNSLNRISDAILDLSGNNNSESFKDC